MAMTAPVFEILSAVPAITSIVPAIRIRGSGYGGESPVAPYITHQTAAGTPENYVGDRPGIDNFRAQIDIWAANAAQAKQIAALVRDALEPHAVCVSIFGDDYDAETKLYRYGFDWSFYTSR